MLSHDLPRFLRVLFLNSGGEILVMLDHPGHICFYYIPDIGFGEQEPVYDIEYFGNYTVPGQAIHAAMEAEVLSDK